MTDDPVKRLNYFDNQFLHAQDFNDEQEYHISMRRLHNSILHTAGVAQGLELVVNSDNKSVTIKPGVAVDALGQEIWLKKEQTKDVSSFAGKTVFATIKYDQQPTDKTEESGGEGYTRWTEEPVIEVKEASDLTQQLIILGRVIVDNGRISSVDDGVEPNRRRLAGAVGGDMEMRTLTLIGSGDDKNLWPKLEGGQDNKLHITTDVEVNGGLRAAKVTSDNAQINTELKVSSLKLTGSGDENTWPKVENQNNKLHVTTGVKVEGDLGVTGSLTATLGTNVVGADQVTDNSIPLKKLNKTVIGPRSTTVSANSTLALELDNYPVNAPKELYFLVHAHTTAVGVNLSWTEGSAIPSTSPSTIQRFIFFSNPSNAVISINYTVLKFLNQ